MELPLLESFFFDLSSKMYVLSNKIYVLLANRIVTAKMNALKVLTLAACMGTAGQHASVNPSRQQLFLAIILK